MQTLAKPKADSKIKQTTINKYLNRIICGDSLKTLQKFPSESVDCVVTSAPYWALRDYGVAGQIGLESTIEEYLNKLQKVFAEIRRVLKPSGTCWVNFGDTYATKTKGRHRGKLQGNMYDYLTKRASLPKIRTRLSIPAKSLCLIPSRFAIRMVDAGWILRNEIMWHKPNVMQQSARDRFTVDFEKIFFFVKSSKYYFQQQFEKLKNPQELSRRYSNPFEKYAPWKRTGRRQKQPQVIRESQSSILKTGRRKRCVWPIGTASSPKNHYAAYPSRLIETPVLAGCPERGVVLDPFMGSGTTALVARRLKRRFIGIELNPAYVKLARRRLRKDELTNTHPFFS